MAKKPGTQESKFFRAIQDLFVGAKVEGESGYINLMRIKARYFEKGLLPRLQCDIEEALQPFPEFREELFDKLYSFFHRYFSESGSIYFRYTPLHQNVYERVYTDDRDVMLFWKTHMLYYVKTDRLFKSMEVEVEGRKFYFDVSTLEHKKANEKKNLIYAFKEKRGDGALVFTAVYSEKGRKTKVTDILRTVRQLGARLEEETLTRACRLFERQSEVDYFINKNARAFLREQFDLWLYQYVFSGDSRWTEKRLCQLQAMKDLAYKIIDFIAQFEDELVRVWNKPKFVMNSHYVITLDRLAEKDEGLLERLLNHPRMPQQVAEWRGLGMVGEDFQLRAVWETDLLGRRLSPAYRFLPVDTKHFPDLEPEIVGSFDNIDEALDGWVIKSENCQALNTLLPKFQKQVTCIYIDPPYNTGDSEILYVNKYKQSSWMSLINDRLLIAKKFLSHDGILCVTIDNFEMHRLRCIIGDIFGDENVLGIIAIRNNPAGRSTGKGFSIAPEYAIFAALNLDTTIGRFERSPEQISRYDEVDEKGRFEWVNFRKHGGANARRIARRRLYYPIYVSEQKLRIPNLEWDDEKREWITLELPNENENILFPINLRGEERTWKWGKETARRRITDLTVRRDQKGDLGVYIKSRLNEEGTLPLTWWDKSLYSATDYGTNLLIKMFGEGEVFFFPKSVYATSDCIKVASGDSEGIVLDFFAGSGTTAHAVINMNRKDNGQRKYILVEIADYVDTVLLPRVKKAIFCEEWKDGKAAGGPGVSHFLKYFHLEQYEDALRRAHYGDADLFANPYESPYSQYVFLRDRKMLDALELDESQDAVRVDLSRLYEGIDVAETLSCVTGKWIKRLTRDYVEFEDGSRVELGNPDWRLIKPLIWW